MAKNEDRLVPLPKNPFKKSDTEILGEHSKELERQRQLLNWTFGFMVAILVVCLVAFITFLLDAWKFHQESYKEYTRVLEELRPNFPSNLEKRIKKLENITNTTPSPESTINP